MMNPRKHPRHAASWEELEEKLVAAMRFDHGKIIVIGSSCKA